MAPEELELGALIDERTTVFVMGRTALVFLSDGTLDFEDFRGPRSLFDVVAQACQPDPRPAVCLHGCVLSCLAGGECSV